MKKLLYCIALCVAATTLLHAQAKDTGHIIQVIFTSDAHYGITRKTFRGQTDVSGHNVNAAMVKQINTLPFIMLPDDGGVNAGKPAGSIDYVVEGGDITNRMEIPNQSATASWAQFDTDYIKGITLKGHNGKPAKLLIIPGNHDISNAIGFYRPMQPATDPAAMVNIYNLMLNPAKRLTNSNYNYATNKINYSKNIGGVHFMFITLWPDSAERIWMEKDLAKVNAATPVIIFTHDQPECEAKHFINPNGNHSINADDKFENLTTEVYKDGAKAKGDSSPTTIEQKGWVHFIKKHPNIKAYFHGNSNYNEYYKYTGPGNDVSLNIFRADSPMKGKYSSKDETKLSFQLITLDTKLHTLTVRECLWNTNPTAPGVPVQWGQSKTIAL